MLNRWTKRIIISTRCPRCGRVSKTRPKRVLRSRTKPPRLVRARCDACGLLTKMQTVRPVRSSAEARAAKKNKIDSKLQ